MKNSFKKINFIIPFFLLNILFISFNLSSKEITNSDVFSYFENPIFQDLWFGIYDKKGIKYGWSNFNEYQKGKSWIFEINIEYKYLETVTDDNELLENEILITSAYKEYYSLTPPFLLEKLEYALVSGKDVENFIATIDDENVTATTDNNGSKNTFVKENFKISISDLLKAEMLLQKYNDWKIGDIINYKSFDASSFEVSDEKDIIEDISSKFLDGINVDFMKVKTVTSDTRAEFFTIFTYDGRPLEYINTMEDWKLESKENAQRISYGGVTFEDRVITVNKQINDNEKLKSLILEIDGEYNGGIYIGDRQNTYTKNGRKYLELNFDFYDDPEVSIKDRKKNLQATSTYPSNDKKIVKLAKKIIGDTKDEWDKVQLLLDYVDTYIEDDYLANPLSVYDILEKKTGDCSEHALLFNTLARAAGIPSRELTGLINYEDNKFGLHAWNEVVIEGYWYPVDPTWNYLFPPLTHIKFQHLKDVPATFNFKLIELEYFD